MQILWIIVEDDEDELDMYEVFMFNTVESEENHVTNKGNGVLPGWQKSATGNRPSLTIALDTYAHLSAKNTSTLESLIRVKIISHYMDVFITDILPAVGDDKSSWLDFTSFVAGFNANEWVLFKP